MAQCRLARDGTANIAGPSRTAPARTWSCWAEIVWRGVPRRLTLTAHRPAMVTPNGG
jgi:hypothetical protein